MQLKPIVSKVQAGLVLSEDEAERVFAAMFAGECQAADVGALLSALHSRGEAAQEIVGAVRAARACQRPAPKAAAGAIDTCGTGGDGQHTFNISTTAALAAAAFGIPVCKHGNRAQTSRSGSADVLEALGFRLHEEPQLQLARCNFAFLFAPDFHPGFAHVAPIRKQLPHRTIFNLIGPLINPAHVERQVIGVFSPEWVRPMAEVVKHLSQARSVVVHGGGTDEFSLWGDNFFVRLENGGLHADTVAGTGGDRSAIAGGDAKGNATLVRAALGGLAHETVLEMVALNLAAALWVSGRGESVLAAKAEALAFLKSGEAGAWLQAAVN